MIAVAPFCIATDEDELALARFEEQVPDRLFALNAEADPVRRLAERSNRRTPDVSSSGDHLAELATHFLPLRVHPAREGLAIPACSSLSVLPKIKLARDPQGDYG